MQDHAGLALDPFGFHGYPASCIAGLGGETPLPDPTYAFHTPYVPVARGHAHFNVRFSGLSARRGTLWLRVHMLPSAPGAVARMAASHRFQLNWLAHHGGACEIRFEAFRGASYALMGLVQDGTDAAADGLSITLDRPGGPEDMAGDPALAPVPEPEDAPDGAGLKTAAMLVSADQPVFAHPVSQPCTAPQLREPEFRARAGRRAGADEWPAAYVVQVLERYGALRPGARGLALGEGVAAVADAVVAAGASCRICRLATGGGEGAVDPASLPGELFGHDFLFSLRAVGGLRGDAAARAFLESAMECLRPGGLAVHILTFGPGPAPSLPIRFDRNGLERAALGLVSRGHQVARLKPVLIERWSRTADGTVPFGLVARRAVSIL